MANDMFYNLRYIAVLTVGCLFISCMVLFSLVCPILILVNVFSSAVLSLVILILRGSHSFSGQGHLTNKMYQSKAEFNCFYL